MRRSVPWLGLVSCVLALCACASRKPPAQKPPPKPIYAGRTAGLDVTNGIQITGAVAMPSGFLPDAARAPIWIRRGEEIAVVGRAGGKSVVLGFSGSGLGDRRIVAEDFGAGAPNGRIIDFAASPDGLELAAAVAVPKEDRVEVVLRETINPGAGHPIASFDGNFDFAQLIFLDEATLALVLHARRAGGDEAGAPDTAAPPKDGIYLITITGQVAVRQLDKIQCPVSRMSFSPNGYFALGEGSESVPPAIFDLRDEVCRALRVRQPIKVLSWSRDSTAFLYRAIDKDGGPGIFRFDMSSGQSSLVAISSGAAAFANDGTIIALGNRELSWRQAAQGSAKVKAEIALLDSHATEINLNSLGFETTPALLAAATMVYSSASDDGIIDIGIANIAGGLLRELIEYSYPARAAFVLASGPMQGPVSMSWSPDGKLVAIVDGNQSASRRLTMLTVLAPPR